jgi:hypothetical protein
VEKDRERNDPIRAAISAPSSDGETVSATNRSNVRHLDDHYVTPDWCVRLVAPYVIPDSAVTILDPCAGSGGLLDTAKLIAPWVCTTAIEIDRERADRCGQKHVLTQHRDAFGGAPWPQASIILTNPPYRHALPFLLRALAEAGSRGTVAFLLRLNFLGSQRRTAFWQHHPCEVYVLSKRPSFTPDGKTDSCEYAWFVFGPERERRWSVLSL